MLNLFLLVLITLDVATSAQDSNERSRIIPVSKLRFGSISYEDFYRLGPHRDTPLALTGIPVSQSPCFGQHRNDSNHLLSTLKENCDGIIRLDKMVSDTKKGRTGKVPYHNVMFKTFIGMLQGGSQELLAELREMAGGPILGLEYCIPCNCRKSWYGPALRIPAFFTGDVSLRTKVYGVHYGEDGAYPALTFSEPGFYTRGHVDRPNNEIWMSMCYGHKTVRMITVRNVAENWGRGAHLERIAWGKLSDDRTVVLNLLFKLPLDLFNEEFLLEQLPGVPVYEAKIEDGDILYVPTSAAHAVLSHDRGLYVISSYVDLNGLLPPNPNQLPVKLDSCQRCGDDYVNYSDAHGGLKVCRGRAYCHTLVSWMLDERMRVPMVDAKARGSNEIDVRPKKNPPINVVMQAGALTVKKQRVRQWFC